MKRLLPKQVGLTCVLALALAAQLAAPMAFGQLKKAPSPEGHWSFKTDVLNDSCTISGEMQITEIDPDNAKHFRCKFQAVQACTGGSIRTIHTDQSCTATQVGSTITIISKVEKIVSTEPPELMKGMDRRYAPDNFSVVINSRGDSMDGMFESQGKAPVKFRRKGELIS